MADVPLEVIDVTTPYPNGEYGEPFKEAFEKVNRNFATTGGQLGRIDTVVAEVEGVKQEVVQMGEDLRAEVDGKIEQIDQQVTAALEDVDTKVNAAIVEIDGKVVQLEQDIPGMVDTAIGSRIILGNSLINPSFRHWQRTVQQTVVSPIAQYLADRWILVVDGGAGGGQVTMSRQPLNVAGTPSAQFALVQMEGFVAATTCFLCQHIEDVRTHAGKTVTVSFYGWGGGNPGDITKIGVRILQRFGAGSNVPDVIVEGGVIGMPTTRGWHSVTLDVPGIEGKNIVGNNTCSLILDIAHNSLYGGQLRAQNGAFAITSVKVEESPVRTAYVEPFAGDDLRACQRYFCKTYDLSTAPGTPNSDQGRIAVGTQYPNVATPTFNATSLRFPVGMRTQPSISIYSAVLGTPGKVTVSTNGDSTANVTIRGINSAGCELNWGNNPDTFGAWFHYTADAELY